MKLGFGLPVSGSWATPEIQQQVARRSEELGYAALWSFQRLLHPAEENALAKVYRSVLDPILPLAHVAAVTSRIRLGLAVLNLPFFSPALLCKQVTTLDVLSQGRAELGVGLGWNEDEFTASGVDRQARGARAEDFLEALEALWSPGVSEFHGRFYDIPPSRMDPQPVQEPHPPVLMGGFATPSLRRAGRLADGWISSGRADLTTLSEGVATVRLAAAEAERDPDSLRFVCRAPVQVRESAESGTDQDTPLRGPIDKIREDLEQLRTQGMTEVFLDLNFDPEIGHPEADPVRSLQRAEQALEAFAPA